MDTKNGSMPNALITMPCTGPCRKVAGGSVFGPAKSVAGSALSCPCSAVDRANDASYSARSGCACSAMTGRWYAAPAATAFGACTAATPSCLSRAGYAYAPVWYGGIDYKSEFQKSCGSLKCMKDCEAAANACFRKAKDIESGKACTRKYYECLQYC